MDTGAIIAGITTYLVQKNVAERQRKWTLEDEKRAKRSNLVGSRLNCIEEVVGLMMSRIDHEIFSTEFNMPKDNLETRKIDQQIKDMISSGWAAISLTGSKELKQKWAKILDLYLKAVEGNVDISDGTKIEKVHISMIKILDEIRLKGS
jgi:hypothetical protein